VQAAGESEVPLPATSIRPAGYGHYYCGRPHCCWALRGRSLYVIYANIHFCLHVTIFIHHQVVERKKNKEQSVFLSVRLSRNANNKVGEG